MIALARRTHLSSTAPIYLIENVPYPAELRGGISAVTLTPSGALVVATRFGEIWIRRDGTTPGEPAAWRLFTRGIDEPMGLLAESERNIYVAHRPELLRVSDTDGDGRADNFDALGAKWGLSQNYHEFFFGLCRDRAGNFYGSPSLDSTVSSGAEHKAAYPKLPVRGQRNFDAVLEPSATAPKPVARLVVRITREGVRPWASGFRQTNGMALSPDGDLFVTDNPG